MKKLLLIVCSLFVIPTKSMESFQLDPALWCNLPRDLKISIKDECTKDDTAVYYFSGSSNWCIPYALRTIDPVKLTYESQTDVDLTPNPAEPILLDPQLWDMPLRLCLDRANTNDCFKKNATTFHAEGRFFDGINNHRLALLAETNKNQHKCYVLHQSLDNAGTVDHPMYLQPIVLEGGWLRSLLLHREINRCVRGMKNVYTNTDKPHCISIGNICKKLNIDENTGIPLEADGHFPLEILPTRDKYELVASLATHFVLRKAVYLGKNTYLGLTEEGDMVSFWLNDHNQLEYALQGCSGKKFKDIDVDETVQSKTGFMPRVGLLAVNGDVYLIDLRREKPILLYTRTLEKPDNIFRFFYDKGQCAVVYTKGNKYSTFHVWPDGFDCALVCISLKYGQAQIEEEK